MLIVSLVFLASYMRSYSYPGVPDPLMELDRPLGGLGLKVRSDVTQTESHCGCVDVRGVVVECKRGKGEAARYQISCASGAAYIRSSPALGRAREGEGTA